jgi:hypothetical protein
VAFLGFLSQGTPVLYHKIFENTRPHIAQKKEQKFGEIFT